MRKRATRKAEDCNCTNVAPGCCHPTMSTWKTRINGRKQKCPSCSMKYMMAQQEARRVT